PVVLLHGVGLTSRYLVPLGRRLAALGYRVLAPDLPGFGRSPKPRGAGWPGAPDVREQTEQLRAWLDACGVERAVLFGNSVGVQVAVEFAARFPERVERLLLEGPTPDPRYRTPLRQYSRVLLNMPFEAPSANALYQVEYLSTGIPRMAQHLVRTVDDPIELRLPDVPVPALVVRGRHDKTLSQPWAEEFTRLLPNGRLVVVEGAAHNAHCSSPELMARLTDVFLRGDLDGMTPRPTHPVDVVADDRGPLPRRRLSPLSHAAMDYASAASLIAVPRALHWGPRTRGLLTTFGILGLADSMMTDYPGGLVQRIPLPVHLNLEASGGLQLVLASLTILRGEPAAGRWAVAAQGLLEVLRSSLTRVSAGPARVVAVPRTSD
ncbi:MAG TPA: alpha/beta hydrolase, partial [Candidatus Limnocylindria bacterium]|nr:alpha/beta hydrolase [Candidatus Limnocylindria bacterium]